MDIRNGRLWRTWLILTSFSLIRVIKMKRRTKKRGKGAGKEDKQKGRK